MKPFFPALLVSLALAVGLAHVLPLLLIADAERKQGSAFVLSYENYRNDLTYLARAREVYDGHSPYSDPSLGSALPNPRNPIPSVLLAVFIALAGGNVVAGYMLALFALSQAIFSLCYALGAVLFGERSWAVAFALVASITPLIIRILNFHGTA